MLQRRAAKEDEVFEQGQIGELETPKLARDTVEVEFATITEVYSASRRRSKASWIIASRSGFSF